MKIAILAVMCLFISGCMDDDQGKQTPRQTGQGNPIRQQSGRGNQGTAMDRQSQNHTRGNADNRIQVADHAATMITRWAGVQQAHVLVMRENAYVGAILDNGAQQLSRKTEDRIARQVRAVNPNVQNVYVSTNPEFFHRIHNYATDVQQGRAVPGFSEQFNEMLQRIFPDAR